MSPTNGALIKLEGVGKTFYTDEVETRALYDIHLEIKAGEYRRTVLAAHGRHVITHFKQ